MSSYLLFLFALVAASSAGPTNLSNSRRPPWCMTTGSAFVAQFQGLRQFDFPPNYLGPEESSAFKELRCTNPPNLVSSEFEICDYDIPLTQTVLYDDRMTVEITRQGKNSQGQFQGTATINARIVCGFPINQLAADSDTPVEIISTRDVYRQ